MSTFNNTRQQYTSSPRMNHCRKHLINSSVDHFTMTISGTISCTSQMFNTTFGDIFHTPPILCQTAQSIAGQRQSATHKAYIIPRPFPQGSHALLANAFWEFQWIILVYLSKGRLIPKSDNNQILGDKKGRKICHTWNIWFLINLMDSKIKKVHGSLKHV